MSIRSTNDDTNSTLAQAERVLEQIIEALFGFAEADGLASPVPSGLIGDLEATAARARRILTSAERISLTLFEADTKAPSVTGVLVSSR